MVKTLACLAVTMTGGAGLLAWMEPKPADLVVNRDLYGRGSYRLAAHRAVGTAARAEPNAWSAIEVLAVAGTDLARRGTLAATVVADDLHFVVSREGNLQPLGPWRRQRSAGNQRRVIRVGVIGTGNARTVPAAQSDALRALLLELAGWTGPLPVRVGGVAEAGADEAPLASQRLRALLAEQGFVS